MDITELIASIDIVEFISQYVDLEQRGEEWWGLSCFKDEKTPSFSVRQDPPVFYDYSSGIGGNVFTFVKFYYKCDGSKAVEILKKYAGISGDMINTNNKLSATAVCNRFAAKKRSDKKSKSTILADDYMNRYERDDRKLKLWLDEGISRQSLIKFDVRFDTYSSRIVYPIKNIDGKIVNVGGRTIDPEWKDKNLRKYCYFYPWGTLDVIYGLFENMESILKLKEIILFEGCKSVLIADTWGIHNTGALLTSHLNPNQLKILAKLGVNVVFALDKDVNILKDYNIAKLKKFVNVTYLFDSNKELDEKDAPVDKGQEVFNRLYNNRLKMF